MRHNPRVLVPFSRGRARLRVRRPIGLLVAVLALLSLICGMAPAAHAAEPPVINKPADQTSPVDVAIPPLTISGLRMHELKATGLPTGLTLEQKSETEAVITGTPTNPESVEVTLEAKNEGEPGSTTFKWTVEAEPPPSLAEPPHQISKAGTPIATLTITGTRLHGLTAENLPKGLTLKLLSETEAQVTGTPTHGESPVVTLHAQNKEGVEASTTFEWTVEAEGSPTINAVADQTATVGKPFSVIIEGARLHNIVATAGLPAELTLKEVPASGETKWEISGTPTAAKPSTEVTLEAKNAEGAATTASFHLTVKETELAPTIAPVPDQTATVGKPFAAVVEGARLHNIVATAGLPAELTLKEVPASGETKGEISGTPTLVKPSTQVTLEAKNAEGAATTATFHLTVSAAEAPKPPPPSGPTATGTPSVSPGVVFSAARATCLGAGWTSGTVATQWLLDGAPIAGAAASTFVPPRGDDGHALACRQTATAGGLSTTLTSSVRMVHEQPPQPSWPISPAALHCASAVCMQQGAGPGAVGQAYPQEGGWWGSTQVRCVSAPWTSAVGSSAQPAVRAFAEAHAVRISLQRVSAGGAVTVASEELTGLDSARDLLDGTPTPFSGAIVVPFGSQSFAGGELWSTRFPGAAGHSNWFAPGGGLVAYGVAGAPGAARSFQLTYTLGAADLGSRLRCVAGADDGPATAPTSASFVSPEYPVSSAAPCGPSRLGASSLPQPAIVAAGEAPCLPAPSSLAPLGASPREVAVKGGRAAVALVCALHGGCRGKLALTAALGAAHVTLAHTRAHVASGAVRVLTLRLSTRGKRALKAAGARGLAASVQLEGTRRSQRLASVRLLASG
jgi:hypothetical protein